MCIFVSAKLQATAAPEAPAPMIRTSTGVVIASDPVRCATAKKGVRAALSTASAHLSLPQAVTIERADRPSPDPLCIYGCGS